MAVMGYHDEVDGDQFSAHLPDYRTVVKCVTWLDQTKFRYNNHSVMQS